jgi:myo-inositol-1(or 4)-monophosphatase
MHTSDLTFVATQAALRAGALLRSGFETDFSISAKAGVQNLVTEYDTAAEKLIITEIHKHFPEHSILAEESGSTIKNTNTVVWIIDPLDGTVNFAHGVPVFSVSIAATVEGKVVCGVIYQPMTNELFVAEKNKGAYLNGRKLSVSNTERFENALMSTGFPYNVDKDPLQCIEKFAKIQTQGVPIRRLGSAAIDLAYLAAGRFDTFWEVGLHPWDVAAGKLLIEEAGGTVTAWDGSLHEVIGYHTILATNGRLHTLMVNQLKD